ncbi:MAG TPA: glutamyl-tRNA reductase [Miltoncostaeaceae bacterium]|nr:glutamyl-tRNA reductase [Miltoncostaeaceae bacterium]
MTLIVLGLSHKTAPIAQREKAALSESEARALLRDLTAAGEVAEAVALSTCNRTEIYASVPDPSAAEDALAAALVARTHISEDELACARYVLRDDRAATQLFRVASSLDSMVVGESEIQGQVRQAWERAVEEGAAGAVLNQLFRQALEVGKQVREQTRIGTGSASVSAVAVELAEEVLDDLPGRQVLLIGAGRMAETTARALVDHGVREVVVANRTVGTARELAGRVGGRGVGFDRLAQELRGADIVISSTDAPHAILRRAELEPVMVGRAARPMVIVDISVPRDVDAAVADVEGVALFDIDDLERVVETNLNGRRLEAERAEGFVIGAVQGFLAWRRGLSASPAIASLHARGEEIRRAELARVEAQWEALSDADRERLEALTKGIVSKLLHEPTVRVRAAAEDGDALRYLESLRHLFALEAQNGS